MSAIGQIARRLARTTAVCDGVTADAELLRRFATDRDEAAFAALVRRHGGLVYDVCRCVLGNDADAEDAFQATFLVLARSAASVRRAGSLAAWLYGVARRTSLKARAAAARRRDHEAARPAPSTASDPDELAWRDVRRVVHEELQALPAAYRDPLVLCHLRGLTQEAAARELGLSRAAVQKRLERGLAKLRAALAGRGLGPAAVLAAATPVAAAPPALLDSTVALIAESATVPAHILNLVDGGTTMIPGKLIALWLVPALVVGVALAGHPGAGEAPARPPVPVPQEKKLTPAEQEMKWLAGEWKVKRAETNDAALLTDEQLADARVVFKDNKAEVKGFEVSYVRDFSFKIDPTKDPKEIDVTFTAGAEKGTTVEGIYLVRKNEMRICLRLMTPELGRPKGYFTGSGTTLYTFILEPVDKKAEPPKFAAPPKPNPPAKEPACDPNAIPERPARVNVTLPAKTPFDNDPKKKDGYLGGYGAGYVWAKGVHLVCPTNPDKDNLHAIRGWVEGWQAGVKDGGTGDLPAKYAPYLTWKD